MHQNTQARNFVRVMTSTIVMPAVALPHIVFLLVDDFGWADAGWHRPAGYAEVETPRMDELVRDGIELDRNCKLPIYHALTP